jgi:hypothetical protein
MTIPAYGAYAGDKPLLEEGTPGHVVRIAET